MLNYFNGS